MERPEFERLAVEHLDAVYRMALSLTRDPNEADEVVQDVYARAFRPSAVARFEDMADESDRGGTGGMRSWLFTITHNVFYTKVKRQARRPTPVGEFFAEAADGPLPGEAPSVWDQSDLDWEQVDSRLKDAIDALKPEHRMVLMMWGVDGLKYREIAEILEVPIGTVMSRLHRARKQVAEALTGDHEAAAELGLGRLIRGDREENEPARVRPAPVSPPAATPTPLGSRAGPRTGPAAG
ncbi:MAG: sigma-70 family RNA polymerase sigma factor [Phycisphaerales bacterium]|nr:MAG: sigma-70 family RNA polymerase sigma factor [Phycisphaerales bacterium]